MIPAIPTGLTITPVGADPTLSLGEPLGLGDTETGSGGDKKTTLASLSPSLLVSESRIFTVPVILDHPHPLGSTGMTEAILALTYDPLVLGVSPSDITLGSIPGLSSWQLASVVDQRAGQIGIELYSTTPITASESGSLVNIAFHRIDGERRGVSPPWIPETAVQLVSSVAPGGQQFTTQVDDAQGQFVLSPGMDRLVVETGTNPAAVAATGERRGVSAPAETATNGLALHGSSQNAAGTSLLADSETNDAAPLAMNAETASEFAEIHTIPTSVVASAALSLQTNVPTGVGQVFQIGVSPPLNTLLYAQSPRQLAADRLFLSLAQDSFWDDAALQPDWLATPTAFSAARTRTDSSPTALEQQPADAKGLLDRGAVDSHFAQWAEEMDEFSDL